MTSTLNLSTRAGSVNAGRAAPVEAQVPISAEFCASWFEVASGEPGRIFLKQALADVTLMIKPGSDRGFVVSVSLPQYCDSARFLG